MYHGNLDIPSSIRETDGVKGFKDEIEKRKKIAQYSSRIVTVYYEINRDFVEYRIVDEGNGFDYTSLPDPRDPENFFKNSGRGLLIIRIHMDEVEWNNRGNEIRMRNHEEMGDIIFSLKMAAGAWEKKHKK